MLGTRMTANLPAGHIAAAQASSMLQRPVNKDDVAQQVVLFCRSDSITGQTLLVDCGRF